jgi:hypothetical protein
MTALSYHTFRIPRGLWKDLEETVIQQDRIFLMEVARSLGLSTQEVLRKCLGTGAPQSLPVLWTAHPDAEPDACPWWECHGEGLWRPCPRFRIAPALPCHIHERSVPCPLTRLATDPYLANLPERLPVRWKGQLFWMDPTGKATLLREDGTEETTGRLRWIHWQGKKCLVWSS